MFVGYGEDYAELCRRCGLERGARKPSRGTRQTMDNRPCSKHGWDGEWFLRAYDAFGHKVGSHECDEGQIYHRAAGLPVSWRAWA